MKKSTFNTKTHLHPGWSRADESDLNRLHGEVFNDPAVQDFSAHYDPRSDSIHLNMLQVRSRDRKSGIGSDIMRRLIDFADSKKKAVTLQTASRGSKIGTSSEGRLKKFYKRFGFTENASSRDYRPDLPGNMNRQPVDRHTIGKIESSQGDGFKITTPHGMIDYRPVDGVNQIWWVESKKKGHGSELVDAMMRSHPAESIAWGATSESGEGLRRKWHKNNPDVLDADGGVRSPFEGQFDPFDHGDDDMNSDVFYSTLSEVDRYAYRSAAIYHKRDGTIFEGPIHPMAHNAAFRAGHPDAHNPHMWDDGFMTVDGTFHDREGRESVNLMSEGKLPLAPREALDQGIRDEKKAQLSALHMKKDLGLDKHFYGRLDEIDRYADLFRSAAIKDPETGTIFEGTWHGDARDKAIAAGVPDEHTWDWEDGFVDHHGNYYNRAEAAEHTRKTQGVSTPAESITMMTQGLLPVDQSLADNPTVAAPYRKKLDDFLHNKKVRASWFDPPSTETKARREANLGEEPDLSKVDQHFYDDLREVDRHTLFRSAAVKMRGSGKVYEGIWHVHAHNVAKEAGEPTSESGVLAPYDDGFVGHDGKFYTRWEAGQMTKTRGETIDMMNAGRLEMTPELASQASVIRDDRRGRKGKVIGLEAKPGSKAEATFKARREVDQHFYDDLDEIERHTLFRSAAIKHRWSGDTFEGTWHEAARQAAHEAGYNNPWDGSADWIDGFVTHDGTFLDRDAAAEFSFDPETRKPGGRESVDLMIKGHLPVDEDLVNEDDLRPSLRRDLKTHLQATGRLPVEGID